MTARIGALIAHLFIPAMWFLVVLHVFLGALGIFGPAGFRGLIRRFTKSKNVRLFSLVLMLFGTIMFVRAGSTKMVFLAKALGASSFVAGGVGLIIPVLGVMIAEWFVDRANIWFRVLGILAIGMAYLFFLAAAPAPVDESGAPTEELHEAVEAMEDAASP